ncbi:pyridoxal phosphate biosynthesis PdxJ family protein [Neorickettsia helminthoeca str. Oregon]|uniref:Pyridoxine 5'-phosphate synthase n=1 Tax=Neorickettsia helminthoeca str. Oregon TaxID=1286528 RepID=X5HLI9_9RICK|nr:pyridoxine 5'-phosphate synthase [Neorickettsia helminthoeca]AHX11265.1 pyridoxal phosphate biosynthesis PdxJ family protein [Neorickettsia helminthoeca str. Oregon]
MTRISINLNKVALIRNARGGDSPDIKYVANLGIMNGCTGITLHPRADARHSTVEDVQTILNLKEVSSGEVEFNLEGDLREELLDLVKSHGIHQFTIVPVREGEKTTERGFSLNEKRDSLMSAIKDLKAARDVRISLFIEPEPASVAYAAEIGCDAVELHAKWYARAFCTHRESKEVRRLHFAALEARNLGLKVNLGHDISLVNISTVINKIKPDEVSVGHALIVESFLQGFPRTLRKYVSIANG